MSDGALPPSPLERPTARAWETARSEAWLSASHSPASLSEHYACVFTAGVVRFFSHLPQDAAAEVSANLGAVLTHCNELAFLQRSECAAYLLWHEVDRYHRVRAALDLLVEHGALPLSREERPFRLLEVGAGPAPAAYAVADYYAALRQWCTDNSEPFIPGSAMDARIMDRGPAWGGLIDELTHHVLLSAGDTEQLCAGVQYPRGVSFRDLRHFAPRVDHTNQRDAMVQRHRDVLRWGGDEEEWEAIPYGIETIRDLEGLAARTAFPSAYDLIVLANFLTEPSMLADLEQELRELTRSLVPGGVLLLLGGTGGEYPRMWTAVADLARQARLQRVVDQVVPGHAGDAAWLRVGGSVVECLQVLRDAAPGPFERVDLGQHRRGVDGALRELAEGAGLAAAAKQLGSFPGFQVHAFRRGGRAIPAAERARMRRRRTMRSA